MRKAATRLHRRRSALGLCYGLLVLAASSIAAATNAGAGAWTKPKGEGQAIVSGLYSQADRAFDADGVDGETPVFRKAEISAFVEYGVTDAFTLLGQTELTTYAVDGPLALDEARFGVSALGGRARLFEGYGAVVSAEITGRLDDWEGVVAGDPEAEADLRLLAGYGFEVGAWPSFVDVQGAYRFDFSDEGEDEVRLDLTAGVRPSPPWLLLLQSFNTVGMATSTDPESRREHKLQMSAVYDISETLSLQVGAFSTVAGRNALDERGIVSAVWVRF